MKNKCLRSIVNPYVGMLSGTHNPYDRYVRVITGIYPECSSVKSMNLGGNAIDTEFLHISCPFIESANQLKGRKYIFEVDEMVLRPGFSVEKGTELQIITPSYQYCNHYGPGKTN